MARAEGGSFGGRGGGPSAGSSRGGGSIGGSRGGVGVAERSGPSLSVGAEKGFSSKVLSTFGKSETRPELSFGNSEKPNLSFSNSPYKSERNVSAKGPGSAFHTAERASLVNRTTEAPAEASRATGIALKSVISQADTVRNPQSNPLAIARSELVSLQNLDKAVPFLSFTRNTTGEKVESLARSDVLPKQTPSKVDLIKPTKVDLIKALKVDLIKRETPTVSAIDAPKVDLTKAPVVPVQAEVRPTVSLIKETVAQPIQSQQETKPQAIPESVTKSILEKVKSVRMPSLKIPQVDVRNALKVVTDKAKKIDLTRVLKTQKRELPSGPSVEGPKVNLVKTSVAPTPVEVRPAVSFKKETLNPVQPVQESTPKVTIVPSVIKEPQIATVTVSEAKPVTSVITAPNVGSEVIQSISQTAPAIVAKEVATIITQPLTPPLTQEGITTVVPTPIRTETTVVTKKIVPVSVRENAPAVVLPNLPIEVKAQVIPDTAPAIKPETAQVERMSVNANALSQFAHLRPNLDDDEETKARKREAENRMILQTARGYVRAGMIATVADAIRFTEQKLRIDPTVLAKGPAIAEKISITPLQVPTAISKQPTEIAPHPQAVPLTQLVSEVSEQSVTTTETVVFASPQSITKPKVDAQNAAPVNNEKAQNVQPQTLEDTEDKKDEEIKFKIDEPKQKNRMAEWDAAIGQTFPAFQWDAQAPLSEIARKLKAPGMPTNSTLIYQVGKKVDGSNESIEGWRTPLLSSDVLVTAGQARRIAEDEIGNKPAVIIKSNGIDADKKHVALVLSGDTTRENYDLAA